MDIPKKVISRIPEMLKQIKQSFPLCDRISIPDNSSDNPFQQVATIHDAQINFQQSNLPDWARELLASYPAKN